ncbi:ABC transporter permease [Vallitalea longa]|uniref:ABC transporter permease n=1 Tax=Vallitalea longa TaxID=2936439 RepID=A0A9W6DDJ7_9FIRM|nr:ABC transporter permease [Vallitalea longa]GKX28290.1 ABC transporter permease [Vallitalea longa]
MFIKLSYKNASRSIKDYGIYFLTLVFGVCIFYMFNSIDAQKGIMALTQTENQAIKSLTSILDIISFFISIVLGFLIVYANGYLIKRRKKELGIYLTLGMEKRQISMILVFETIVLAIVALLVGLTIGILGSHIMSIFTAKMFEVNMASFKFIFSPNAALKSVIYFSVIFVVVTLFNTITVSKCRLIDLLYANKKNQELRLRNTSKSIFLFIISLICLASAYYLILTNGIINISTGFFLTLLLGILGTYLFFLSIASILTKTMMRTKKLYLKNLNMFVVRQISSMVNTNVISMTIVCITLLLAIGTLSSGVSMANFFSSDLTSKTPFDISFFYHDDFDIKEDKLSHDLEQYTDISKYTSSINIFSTYSDKNLSYEDIIIDKTIQLTGYFYRYPVDIISLSDYNKNAESQGHKTLSLSNDEFAVINTWDKLDNNFKLIENNNITIDINKKDLYLSKIIKTQMYSNDRVVLSPTLIVNDSLVKNMIKTQITLNANFNNKEDENNFLSQYRNSPHRYPYFSKDNIYTQAVEGKTISAFLAIYLGFVFLITCAAILSIQQLSQSSDNKYRYELLKNLGTDENMLNRTLFYQILIYFLMPLSLAIVHSIVGLTAVNAFIIEFSNVNIIRNIVISALFLIIIYGSYFVATYIGSKNVIRSKKMI